MVGRGDQHGVDILPRQQVAKVVVGVAAAVAGAARLFGVLFFDQLLRVVTPLGDNIADGYDLNVRVGSKMLQVAGPCLPIPMKPMLIRSLGRVSGRSTTE